MTKYTDPQLDLDAKAQAVSDITFHPTLLIGVGGTGAEVLRRVKRLYQTRSPLGARLHRFVFIDTDTRTFLDREGLPPVDPIEERCLIGVHQAEVYVKNKAQHKWITDRFPSDRMGDTFVRNLAQGQGAGQLRSVGAMALMLDYQHVFEQITRAHTSLTTMARTIEARDAAGKQATVDPKVVVYVVGSLAGGTGSGCFLDVALIAQHICHSPHLIGMFALPEAFEEQVLKDREQVTAVKANTYAALKELQYVLDAGHRTAPVTFSYGQTRTHVLDPADRVFQLCYVVSNRNRRGGLGRPDELFELMARTIYQDTGSPFGTSKRVFDANCHVLSGAATPCPRTKRPRLFSTVSTASLVFPAMRVGYYCTNRTLEEVIHDSLLGPSVPQEDVDRTVTGFLAGAHLDERGATNQILDSLLTDPSAGGRLSASEFGLSLATGTKSTPAKFVADMQGKWQSFLDDSSQLPRAIRLVAENADRRLGQGRQPAAAPIGPALEAFCLATASTHGVEAVRDVLDELQQVAQQMRREIEGEIQEWNRRERETFRQDFDRLCRELTDMGVIRRKLSNRGDVLKRRIVTLFNDYVGGELLQAARSRALAVVNALESATAEQRKRWDALASRLRDLKGLLNDAAKRHETHGHGAVRSFVVERDATESGFESRYFSEHRLGVNDAMALIAESAGSRQELVSRLVSATTMRQVNDALWNPIVERYMQPLVTTDVIDFVGESLDERLRDLLDMCQPFWNAEVPAVDIQFPEFVGVSAAPDAGHDLAAPPARLGAWAAAAGHSYVVGHVPYEIVLSRRTYGARASYLRSAADWQAAYTQKRAEGKGQYMLQTHVAFEDLGDLE